MQHFILVRTLQVCEDLAGHLDAHRAAADDGNAVGCLEPLALCLRWAQNGASDAQRQTIVLSQHNMVTCRL